MLKINYKILIISLVLTLPVLGFVSGLIMCTDCGGNIFGRVFVGLIYTVLTTLSFGQPLLDEGGANFINLRWYIIPVFVILYFLLAYISRKRKSGSQKI